VQLIEVTGVLLVLGGDLWWTWYWPDRYVSRWFRPAAWTY